MNKAFENIIDKLREVPTEYRHEEYNQAIYDVINFISKVAIDYNNGWISCSERLPEEYTVLCCDKYGEMIVGHPYFDEVSNTNYSAESDNEMMYNCVAWQPLPEPFKESD